MITKEEVDAIYKNISNKRQRVNQLQFEAFTGSTDQSHLKVPRKDAVPSMFSTNERVAAVRRTDDAWHMQKDRYETTSFKNASKIHEPLRVNRGVGLAAGDNSQTGIHPTYRAKHKTVDELRIKSNQKQKVFENIPIMQGLKGARSAIYVTADQLTKASKSIVSKAVQMLKSKSVATAPPKSGEYTSLSKIDDLSRSQPRGISNKTSSGFVTPGLFQMPVSTRNLSEHAYTPSARSDNTRTYQPPNIDTSRTVGRTITPQRSSVTPASGVFAPMPAQASSYNLEVPGKEALVRQAAPTGSIRPPSTMDVPVRDTDNLVPEITIRDMYASSGTVVGSTADTQRMPQHIVAGVSAQHVQRNANHQSMSLTQSGAHSTQEGSVIVSGHEAGVTIREINQSSAMTSHGPASDTTASRIILDGDVRQTLKDANNLQPTPLPVIASTVASGSGNIIGSVTVCDHKDESERRISDRGADDVRTTKSNDQTVLTSYDLKDDAERVSVRAMLP